MAKTIGVNETKGKKA